jgi:SPP1 family predicted phage head-tail adaptor
MMRVGSLDRYIRIERKVVTKDEDYGSEIIEWRIYKECWANVQDITSRMQESTNSDLRLLKRPCKITVRYDDGIDAKMRVVMIDRDNRVLQITSKPAELGRRESMEFMAEDYSENV